MNFEYSKAPKREYFQINEYNRVNSWTRAVDHSHWLDQHVERTIIGTEYPCEWDGTNDRFYPKPFGGSGVTFPGRLAPYKYLDMDDVVAQVMVKLPGIGTKPPCVPLT